MRVDLITPACVVQIATFFERNLGPVAKLNVQRDCRRLISLGNQRHTARLATERALQRLLRYGCCCGTPLQSNADAMDSSELKSKKLPSIAGSGGQQKATTVQGLLSGLQDPENANQQVGKASSTWKLRRGNSGSRVAPCAVAEAPEASGDTEDVEQGKAPPQMM
jgi:hypothetical protein